MNKMGKKNSKTADKKKKKTSIQLAFHFNFSLHVPDKLRLITDQNGFNV